MLIIVRDGIDVESMGQNPKAKALEYPEIIIYDSNAKASAHGQQSLRTVSLDIGSQRLVMEDSRDSETFESGWK